MKNYIHTFSDENDLESFLYTSEVQSNAKDAKSIFVQIFSSQDNRELLGIIIDIIEAAFPASNLIGSTTVGEIVNGCLQLNSIVISISFFESTLINSICKSCSSGEESAVGEELIQNIINSGDNIAGVLILATPLNIALADIFTEMSKQEIKFPIFGGGAGVYNSSKNSLVFCGSNFIESGIIAVVFLSNELYIYANSQLGWQPLTKEMTITESDGLRVKSVDNMSAFNLYSRYLDIKKDDQFFLNVLEFPFLLERDNYMVARVPFFVDENGEIGFIADVREGEKFRIGYGDPELIVRNSKLIQNELEEFRPDAIFIFACICRRFLMQDDVNRETEPFQTIAETTGFFTYGEFFSHDKTIQLLNSTIVVVGMREGKRDQEAVRTENFTADLESKPMVSDPFSEKHNQIVSRLLHFISVLSTELEYANNELTYLSEVDKLTQLCNRLKLDKVLSAEIKRSETFHTGFSVILLDIDKFKNINDTHGHLTGDTVLIELADLLKGKVRKTDTVGRWGGEEFLLILPLANLEQSCSIAENIRAEVCSHVFLDEENLSCSFGVTSYYLGDTSEKLILRADKALYQAKNNGRNRVDSLI